MRFFLLTIRKDLLRVLRDPTGYLIWIAMPMLITGLVSLVSGGEPLPHGTLLVVDNDRTFASRSLTAGFDEDPLKKMVSVEKVDYAEGRKRIDAGEASALLLVPKGFGDNFVHRRHSRLDLWVNPSQYIVPKVIEEALSGMLDIGFYVQTATGNQLEGFTKPPSDETVARMSVAMNHLAQDIATYRNGTPITFETTVTGKRPQQGLSVPAMFFPGMLILAVFGLCQSFSFDWWVERQSGTLRRAMSSPPSLMSFVAGKLTAVIIVVTVIAAFGLSVARWVLNAPTAHFLLTLLWTAAAGAMLSLLNSLLQMPVGDQRAGVILNQLFFFVCSLIGGSFFPFEFMPNWLASIGRWTPNGFAISHFKDLTAGKIEPTAMIAPFLILGGFTLVAFVVLCQRMRKWAM